MTDAGARRTQWVGRPLSRRYGLAVIDVAIVRLCDADGLHDRRVRWAVGWLADGECEALGAWMDTGDDDADQRRSLADLQARGAERIWHMAGTGTGIGLVQGHVSKSELLEAEQVRAGLVRAIRRHGSFETGSAVLDFMADALQRAERRLDRERLVAKGRARLDSGVQMAPPGL